MSSTIAAAGHAGLRHNLPVLATGLGCLGILLASSAGPMMTIGAAGFLACWTAVLLADGRNALERCLRTPGLLLLPAVVMASVAWSAAPAHSLRAALQFGLTAAFAVLAARSMSPRSFVAAVSASLAAGALLCLAFGRVVVDPLDGRAAFVGIFAAKNSMAFFMALLIIFGLGCALDRRLRPALRLLGAASLILAVPMMIQARSAGALVTSVLAAGVLIAVLLLAKFHPRARQVLAGAALLLSLPALFLVALLALGGTLGEVATGFIVDTLGKDLTLTGRTILWQHAMAQIERAPLLGIGYQAFWQHGNPWAEALWRAFYISGRSGFHFHNTFIDTQVGLGIAGLFAIAVLLLGALRRSLRRCLDEATPAAAALVAVATCLLTRAFFEVDATYPFAIGTFLLFAVATYGLDHARQVRMRLS